MVDAGLVTASGERVIDIILQRHREGVRVRVKVKPEVEDFFKRWGGGATEAPSHGRMWKSLSGEKLTLWSFETPLNGDDNMTYSLFHTGTGFHTDHGNVNLSFIRLVGAVEGKEFICDTVMSRTELDKVAAKLRRAAEHFYTEYIQPVHLNIFVGVRDIGRDGVS